MALYLGGQRVAPAKAVPISVPVNGAVTGQANIDKNGVLTFPKLDFTPKMIVIWNIEARDLKQEALIEGEEWEDDWVRYIYQGAILTAINIGGIWISQALHDVSGETIVSNATRDAGSMISFDGEHYSYQINRYGGYPDNFDGYTQDWTTFNYAIYS